MASPEFETPEKFQVDKVEKELIDYMKGAGIGSPKLLAYSDEVRYRILWEMIDFLGGSNKKADLPLLYQYRMEEALLNHQIENRRVEIKGYAKASSQISDLLSNLKEGYRRQALQEGVTDEKIDFYLDDTYTAFMFKMIRILTGEEQHSDSR